MTNKIVKYGNRKYYNPIVRDYQTIAQLVPMVVAGQRIYCYKTRNDITKDFVRDNLHLFPGADTLTRSIVGE
jgi:polyhydroxyalkanoate synthesis regulator protein